MKPILKLRTLLSYGLLALFAAAPHLKGQTSEDPELGQVVSNYTVDQDVFGGGVFYYQIVVADTGETVARGKMDVEGIDRIILAPETTFRFLSFYAETLSFGWLNFTTPPSGRTFVIPCLDYLEVESLDDTDGDGLADILEDIAGTSVLNPDTDGDGFEDGAEVTNGQDPLDGFIVATGVVANGPTSSPAVDICTINNTAIVAMGAGGVSVFNVRNGFEPVRIAQIDTPGSAEAVACYGDLVVVADGTAGVAIIDISDPPAARIIRQVRLSSSATSVASRGNIAFVGLLNGEVVVIDMITGLELSRSKVSTRAIQDIGIREEQLYVLTEGTLYTFDISGEVLLPASQVDSPGSLGAGRFRLRLFVGDDFLYATFTSGFNIFDISTLDSPTLVEQVQTRQQGWKQIVATGTGLAVAAVSPNSTRDGPHHIDIYDVGDDNRGSEYLTTLETPGLATALSIYNALAYVADDSGGLQVLNYASFDAAGQPPEIMVRYNSADGKAEEGKILSVVVDVTDDVQARNVQFFVDGVSVAIDGNFPFEIGLPTPLITATKRDFSFYVIASDTGGNVTRSETITLELVPDATPPQVRKFTPGNGSVLGRIDGTLLSFSEPIDQSTLNTTSLKIVSAGADGLLDTADDGSVALASLDYQEATNSLGLGFTELEAGLYRIEVAAPLADLAGNVIKPAQRSTFRIYGFADADLDGVPDDLEALLGFDPDNPDTDGDGVKDGDEDNDNDGLSNIGEVILERDPLDDDSDDNGVKDGDEDSDFDSLSDGEEIERGTDPLLVDSDGDGIDDAAEVADGLDPLDPSSAYAELVVSSSVAYINGAVSAVDTRLSVTVVSPTVAFINGLTLSNVGGESTTIVSPTVSFLNGIISPRDSAETHFEASPIVSFENE